MVIDMTLGQKQRFNPRPCVRGDGLFARTRPRYAQVSIHAPV